MQPITTPTSPPSLEEDVFCRCGYNLRGIPRDSRCPECGRPVQFALNDAARPWLLRDCRLARWGCLCFLGALLAVHHQWFVRGRYSFLMLMISPGAMLAGAYLFPKSRTDQTSGDLVHRILFRALSIVWLILAVIVVWQPYPITLNARSLRLPLTLAPVLMLYFMNHRLRQWHTVLHEPEPAIAYRVMSWLFPVAVAMFGYPGAYYVDYILFIPMRDVVRWVATTLFFAQAFLLGVTWYSAFGATRDPRPIPDQT